MRRLLYAVLLSFCGLAAAHAAGNPQPTGRWITANHTAVIQIAPCGGSLCGQIVGIALAHPSDQMPRAWQGQSQCGMVILQTAPVAQPAGTTAWIGSVLDPRSGSVYHARMVLDSYRRLLLHGYIGLPVFGQTQVWTPYSGPTSSSCRFATSGQGTSRNG